MQPEHQIFDDHAQPSAVCRPGYARVRGKRAKGSACSARFSCVGRIYRSPAGGVARRSADPTTRQFLPNASSGSTKSEPTSWEGVRRSAWALARAESFLNAPAWRQRAKISLGRWPGLRIVLVGRAFGKKLRPGRVWRAASCAPAAGGRRESSRGAHSSRRTIGLGALVALAWRSAATVKPARSNIASVPLKALAEGIRLPPVSVG
jgi:hypothetical protein